jgi:hypothetical protein
MSAVNPVPDTEVVCGVEAEPKHEEKADNDAGVAATEVVGIGVGLLYIFKLL